MRPQFTRPENPILFAGREEFLLFLANHYVKYWTWEDGRPGDLWDEIRSTDTLITVEKIPGTEITAVFRNIRTVTLRITFEKQDDSAPGGKRVVVLVEYRVGKNGELIPREHPQSSVTEKMHWHQPGYEERPAYTLVRVLEEELGIQVTHERLVYGENLIKISPDLRMRMARLITTGMVARDPKTLQKKNALDLSKYYHKDIEDHLKRNIELDVRWSGKKKYPGIAVRNQLVHYWLKLHPDNYKEEGYVEVLGRYRSLWESSLQPPEY